MFAAWNSPFSAIPTFDKENCAKKSKKIKFQWPYKNTFISNDETILSKLYQILTKTYKAHLARLSSIHEMKITIAT